MMGDTVSSLFTYLGISTEKRFTVSSRLCDFSQSERMKQKKQCNAPLAYQARVIVVQESSATHQWTKQPQPH